MGQRIGLLSVFIFFLWVGQAWAAGYTQAINSTPNPRKQNTWISDPQKVISSKKKQFIKVKLDDLKKKTGIEFAVVVHNDLPVSSQKEFAHRLFNTWKIGQAGKNNGLLFTFAVKQKKWAFETGYGLEAVFPDSKQKLMFTQVMAPQFKAGKYGEGLLAGVKKIAALLIEADAKDSAALSAPAPAKPLNPANTMDASDTTPVYKPFDWSIWLPALLTILALAAWVYGILDYRKRMKWPVPRDGGRSAAENIYFRLLLPLVAAGVTVFSWAVFLRADELLWGIAIIIFVYFLYYFRHRGKVRDMPRQCPQAGCQTLMTRLDEKKEDQHLDSGQEKEEELDSVQYDVWYCDEHERIIIEDYEQFMSGYSRCKYCKAKTLEDLGSTVVVAPTYSSSGRGRTDYKCRHCNKSYSVSYTIARKQRPSSSSSSSSSWSSGSSGSSSSGSSFGGGSSGGGGASGSW